MNAEQPKRRGSHAMVVAIVLLAFAVFSWGVRYKLSLYNPAAHMSAAKLLSQRERPATFEAAKLATDPPVNPGLSTLFALAVSAMFAGWRSLKLAFSQRNEWHGAQLHKQPTQTFFFFRPPPFLLASK
jgi:hypothetical protein